MGIKEKLTKMVIKPKDISCLPGEKCFFYSKAKFAVPQSKTTTKVKPGFGIGVAVPITKHFGIGLSRHRVKTQTSTRTVWDKKACGFYVMSERFVIRIDGREKEIDFDRVTGMAATRNAVKIACGSESCYIFMRAGDIRRFKRMYKLVAKAHKAGIDMKTLFPN